MPELLVVEDDFALGIFLSQALGRASISFRLAQNGEIALQLANECWPAVVLLDLTLPGALDGWQVWEGLSAQAAGRSLRVVLFGAELGSGAQHEARQCGCWAILNKPVSRVRLVEHIRRALAEAANG